MTANQTLPYSKFTSGTVSVLLAATLQNLLSESATQSQSAVTIPHELYNQFDGYSPYTSVSHEDTGESIALGKLSSFVTSLLKGTVESPTVVNEVIADNFWELVE